MKHNCDVPGQLALFAIAPSEARITIHDPYWDEVEIAPEHPQPEDRWNPADFGEVPFIADGNQLTIFPDDSQEPPDPDDYQNPEDYQRAWAKWTDVKVGDFVKLSSSWMDKCAAVTTGKFKKDYQYKSDEELICEVTWVDPLLMGHIRVARGNNKALYVPFRYYTVESVRAQVTNSTIETAAETQVLAQVALDTQSFAPEQNTHWVERYWVQRNTNKYFYYRYCWMVGRKKNRVHLGSVDSIIARRKKADVEVWIGDGYSPIEIEKLIRSGAT
jgi:hypothetical protein